MRKYLWSSVIPGNGQGSLGRWTRAHMTCCGHELYLISTFIKTGRAALPAAERRPATRRHRTLQLNSHSGVKHSNRRFSICTRCKCYIPVEFHVVLEYAFINQSTLTIYFFFTTSLPKVHLLLYHTFKSISQHFNSFSDGILLEN